MISRRTTLQIRRYGRHFAVLVLVMVIGAGAGFYILLQQRLPNPFKSYYDVNGAFSTAVAVVPGLGEPVNVAGVHVGEITGTSLHGGQAVVRMQIDPSKIRRLYRDATADLVPNTPLMDMQVDIAPGSPSAGPLPAGVTIPVAQTLTPVASDELLGTLDADTRTWLVSLITQLNVATTGRSRDIRALFGALGPTSAQFKQIGDLLAGRHAEIAQIVHNLGVLTMAASADDAQLATFVRGSDQTVQAFASQDAALSAGISRLPGTLQVARNTLRDSVPFSNALGPTTSALLPSARALPSTLRNTRTLLRGAALVPLEQVRPLVAAAQPLVSELPPLARDLRTEVPAVTDSFKVLAYLSNETAYDPGGRNPGFLYWLAWFAHNSNSFISNADANGSVWRGLMMTSCAALKSLSIGVLLETVLGTNFGCG